MIQNSQAIFYLQKYFQLLHIRRKKILKYVPSFRRILENTWDGFYVFQKIFQFSKASNKYHKIADTNSRIVSNTQKSSVKFFKILLFKTNQLEYFKIFWISFIIKIFLYYIIISREYGTKEPSNRRVFSLTSFLVILLLKYFFFFRKIDKIFVLLAWKYNKLVEIFVYFLTEKSYLVQCSTLWLEI